MENKQIIKFRKLENFCSYIESMEYHNETHDKEVVVIAGGGGIPSVNVVVFEVYYKYFDFEKNEWVN